MEIRKDSISTVKLCRFCLSKDSQDLRSLYDRSGGRPRNSVPLTMKILTAMGIEVFPSDKMPSFICNRCSYFMDICFEYKQICRQADESILHYVQTGSCMKPISWPNTLEKAHQSVVVKTVVGGATVELCPQGISDDDGEDDENVYKVKLGDGQQETRIKVITNDDTKKTKKDVAAVTKSRVEQAGDEETVGRGEIGVQRGCWPCTECRRSYPLQQLLQLHTMQKHRARTVACNHCTAKFFNKYDLSAHMGRHSEVSRVKCTVCNQQFNRLSLLRRHERKAHKDLPHLLCPEPKCSADFLSAEALKRHSDRSHGKQATFACDECDKKFITRSTLLRHKNHVHNPNEETRWSCDYCSDHFQSPGKLAKHVRAHAGEKPYPCKYCDKSFIKSHHHTRHVRVKHAEELGSEFRCVQCRETFDCQDTLMYHSAIHATQDLTCPLCHEQFDNVDGVTAHIKSHAGMEFLCDYCELVFTSQHKLDEHLVAAHEEELQNEHSQDESSTEMEHYEDEDGIHVKEEEDHMLVEINKPASFILSDSKGQIDYKADTDNTCSEESDTDITYDTSAMDTISMPLLPALPPLRASPAPAKPTTVATASLKPQATDNKTAPILRKAEEVKRKLQQKPKTTATITSVQKEVKPVAKVEPTTINSGGNDKSLKLLEKELQELQRTTTPAAKTPAKPVEPVRNTRRPPINTSTPKLRSTNEKKPAATPKTPVEKKVPERRAIKDNKEPKEAKTPIIAKDKEEKDKLNNTGAKEEKDKDTKEKDTPTPKVGHIQMPPECPSITLSPLTKSAVKNGSNENSDETVRRSARPSKLKDYAKMAQETSKDGSDDDSDDAADEEYADDSRAKPRRVSAVKQAPKPPAAKLTPKKRGRPRKEQPAEVPAKVSKNSNDEEAAQVAKASEEADESNAEIEHEEAESNTLQQTPVKTAANTEGNDNSRPSDKNMPEVLKSPMGQTLKKVPVKSLPPGIKPMPLPSGVRAMTTGSISEMQIGKKIVKVQKIVMTKAEVEAMAKKGLLEMKDGTMVLKHGVKLPTSTELKTAGGEDKTHESPCKEKTAPTRCDLEED